jgi:hypothetical protein
MITLFLKFTDEQEAITALPQFRQSDKDGLDHWVTHNDGNDIDVIGTIYKPTGAFIETEMGDIPETAPLPGFHVNYIGNTYEPTLDQYVVVPSNPSRVFA